LNLDILGERMTKLVITLALIALAITARVMLENLLPNNVFAIVTGMLCGISTVIPVSIWLLDAVSRAWSSDAKPREPKRLL